MGLPLYLAMTAAEMEWVSPLPDSLAYMACHFSPYSTGLSNLPRQLPPDSMLTVNDRTPICGHDPNRIAQQLKHLLDSQKYAGVLLDLQRPADPQAEALAAYLVEELPCPVAVSHHYASGLSCPVFLPPVPPDIPLVQYIQPWHSREIWLEAALDGLCLTVTQQGCSVLSVPHTHPLGEEFRDETLHCHYRTEIIENGIRFHLRRTREDLNRLMEEAASLGISTAVGLYQELN